MRILAIFLFFVLLSMFLGKLINVFIGILSGKKNMFNKSKNNIVDAEYEMIDEDES